MLGNYTIIMDGSEFKVLFVPAHLMMFNFKRTFNIVLLRRKK